MPKRIAVPRASITCTVLDDQEWMLLQQDGPGREACHLFVSLLIAAKAQGNSGKFTAPPPLVAMMVRWPVADYLASLAILTERTDWLKIEGETISVRSWKKWNNWGGKRDNAGRKPSSTASKEKVQRARNIVNNEVTAGRMRPASEQRCFQCTDPADEYHHDDYEQPLEVIPVCKKCHGRIHVGNQVGSNGATSYSVSSPPSGEEETPDPPGGGRSSSNHRKKKPDPRDNGTQSVDLTSAEERAENIRALKADAKARQELAAKARNHKKAKP